MSATVTSALGDVPTSRIAPSHWTAAVIAALALHAVGAAAYWLYAPEVTPAAQEEVRIGVQLGPPGGRLDPAPAPKPQQQTPAAPPPPSVLAERAADAAAVTFTEAPPPAPDGARLSSGVGAGGTGASGPPAPPPPPAEPQLDPAALRAYINAATQLIFEKIQYPERARQRMAQGRAGMRLLIDRQGRLLDREMRLSTGDPLLDDAIIQAIDAVSRFPPLPASYPHPRLRLAMTIRFELVRDPG